MSKTTNTLSSHLTANFQIFAQQKAIIFEKQNQIMYHSYRYLDNQIKALALALMQLNINKGDRVLFLVHRHHDWIIADLATISIGAISVALNPSLPVEVISQIVQHCTPKAAFLENQTIYEKHKQAKSSLARLRRIIFLSGEKIKSRRIYHYRNLIESHIEDLGNSKELGRFSRRALEINPHDTLSIIYTASFGRYHQGDDLSLSETDNAVELTNLNILTNVLSLSKVLNISHRDLFLSVLPTWNPMHRIVVYLALYRGSSLSLLNPLHFFHKTAQFEPTYLVSLPRFWDLIHRRIEQQIQKRNIIYRHLFYGSWQLSYHWFQAIRFFTRELTTFRKWKTEEIGLTFLESLVKLFLISPIILLARSILKQPMAFLGSKLKIALTGGMPLSRKVDIFFSCIGPNILSGYGIPESGSIVTIRRPPSYNHRPRRVLFTSGPLLDNTDIKLIDPGNGQDVTYNPGAVGIIYLRGNQLMKGYYRNSQKTLQKFDNSGWFKTSDMGRFTNGFELQIVNKKTKVSSQNRM